MTGIAARASIASALFAMLAIAASPAYACKGSEVLFRDDFSDEDPAWNLQDTTVEVKDGAMQFKVEPGKAWTIYYQGDFFPSADACVDMIAPISKDANVMGGLAFWGNNKSNIVWVAPGLGTAGVSSYFDGRWADPVPSRKFDGIKATPNAANTIRVTWKGPPKQNSATPPDPTVTIYINDKQFVKFKVPPNGDRNIGLYAQEGPLFSFKNLIVTRF